MSDLTHLSTAAETIGIGVNRGVGTATGTAQDKVFFIYGIVTCVFTHNGFVFVGWLGGWGLVAVVARKMNSTDVNAKGIFTVFCERSRPMIRCIYIT